MYVVVISLLSMIFFLAVGVYSLIQSSSNDPAKKQHKNTYLKWGYILIGLSIVMALMVVLALHQHKVITSSRRVKAYNQLYDSSRSS